ncbi:uncharacterized protein LOC125521147 [Triticum urartu]|uniref:uncharacterized protein LOC125521147 n=1 Tax=Triticum urartu TaxID=4572 RepID=UPI00204460B3|nr:uncharacterized protein LOC125521147 [Triticum urartu]XP_048542152.1 uncharacterized protein LOC125521147 [Triticum urartu]XP_048542153.1 uncharacterized protein LOC125521147 [Triticum urartu]
MQFKNRWENLKTMYCQWKQLQIDASGLGWNAKLGTIDADTDWWNTHLIKNPEHAKYRNGGPPNLAEMDLMFDDRHVTGAESAIPGEIPLDKEDVSDDTDSAEDDDEVIKAKPKKQQKTKSCKDDFSAQDEKNPFVRMYKKASDAICVTAESIKEASSSSMARPPPPLVAPPPTPVGPSMNEAMEMVRECGVEEGTPLFFSSSMLFMKAEYREMFASVQTKEGRLMELTAEVVTMMMLT